MKVIETAWRVDVCDKKYTVVSEGDGRKFYALRYGEMWLENLHQLPGSRMIYAMASELEQAKLKIKELEMKLRSCGPRGDMA